MPHSILHSVPHLVPLTFSVGSPLDVPVGVPVDHPLDAPLDASLDALLGASVDFSIGAPLNFQSAPQSAPLTAPSAHKTPSVQSPIGPRLHRCCPLSPPRVKRKYMNSVVRTLESLRERQKVFGCFYLEYVVIGTSQAVKRSLTKSFFIIFLIREISNKHDQMPKDPSLAAPTS